MKDGCFRTPDLSNNGRKSQRQIAQLEAEYAKNPHPSQARVQELAELLGLPFNKVNLK